MIDNLALGITHGLMLLAAFLLLGRRDLNRESSPHDRPSRDRSQRKPDRDA